MPSTSAASRLLTTLLPLAESADPSRRLSRRPEVVGMWRPAHQNTVETGEP
jgi:hypothetical protein